MFDRPQAHHNRRGVLFPSPGKAKDSAAVVGVSAGMLAATSTM